MKYIFLYLFIAIFFISCSSRHTPYKPHLDPKTPLLNTAHISNLNQTDKLGLKSPVLAIISPMGSALTLWALAPGNWIWGYTLDNSKEFGGARLWQVINLGGDIALIQNVRTNTCLSDDIRGVMHRPCDRNNKKLQWQLLAMDNGAIQLKSTATNNCISTTDRGIAATGQYFSITMQTCKTTSNFDQQWIFISPPIEAKPLLGDR